MTVRVMCMLAIALVTGSATAAVEQPRYNVLLFTADDMHAESMQTYGSKVKDLTPQSGSFCQNRNGVQPSARECCDLCAESGRHRNRALQS